MKWLHALLVTCGLSVLAIACDKPAVSATQFAIQSPPSVKKKPEAPAPEKKPDPPRYETRKDHDPDGIGKFYMGREIAQVMGHQAADWLDRPEREEEEAPKMLLKA